VNEAEVRTALDGNIQHLIVPQENLAQIEKVPLELRKGLKVTGVCRLMDVLDQLFVCERRTKGGATLTHAGQGAVGADKVAAMQVG
jgi:ATP-dependent Lon protease